MKAKSASRKLLSLHMKRKSSADCATYCEIRSSDSKWSAAAPQASEGCRMGCSLSCESVELDMTVDRLGATRY